MGLLIQNIPTGTGELIRVETLPLVVEPNQSFEDAKQLLEQMVASAGSLANSITTEEDYNRGMKMLQGLKLFLKNIDEGVKPAKDRINEGKDRLMNFIHELDVPAKKLQADLAKETGRFKVWQEEQVRKENERLAREAEAERQRKQHEADLDALRAEIELAVQTADEANGRNQTETAAEIKTGLRPIVTTLRIPQAIENPIQVATQVRQIVALALQHESARIAAAQAKAEGDKKAAAAILKASAKLEAPVVEEVRAEQVMVAPVMVRHPDLFQAKGASVSQNWRVKAVFDPARVCREHPELCEPSQSKLNDLAKRLKAKPNVGGVEWEQITKTIGVR
jgi:hypothetical protein